MIAEDLANLANPTPQERTVIRFILEQPSFVGEHTAEELARATFTSAATITRLCKRVGFRGFADFKVRFVSEWSASSGSQYARLTAPLVEHEAKPAEISDLMPRFYNRVIYETNRLLDFEKLDDLCRRIAAGRRIFVYATGLNRALGEEFCFKMQTLGIDAQASDTVNVQALKHGQDVRLDVAVVISHSGVNAHLLDMCRLLRGQGIWCAALTPAEASPIARACDLSLRLFRTTSTDRLSLLSYPISARYIFDLVYGTLFSQSIDDIFDLTAAEFYAHRDGAPRK